MNTGNYIDPDYYGKLYCFHCHTWKSPYRDLHSSLDKVKKSVSQHDLKQLFFRKCPSCDKNTAIYWPDISLFIKLSNNLRKLDSKEYPEAMKHENKDKQLNASLSRLLFSDFGQLPKSVIIRDINLVAYIIASWGEIEFAQRLLGYSLNSVREVNLQDTGGDLKLYLDTITLVARIRNSSTTIDFLHEAVAISLYLNDWYHAIQNIFDLTKQLIFARENRLSSVNYAILSGLESYFGSVHDFKSQYLDLTILQGKYTYTIIDFLLEADLVDGLKDEYEIFDIELLLRRAERIVLAGRTRMAIKMLERVLVGLHRLRDLASYSIARLKVTTAIRPIKEKLITLYIRQNEITSAYTALSDLKTRGFISDLDVLKSHAAPAERNLQWQIFHELSNKLWNEQLQDEAVALVNTKDEQKDEHQAKLDLSFYSQDLDDHVLYADFFVTQNVIFVFLIKKGMPREIVKEVDVDVFDIKNFVISSFADKDKVKTV